MVRFFPVNLFCKTLLYLTIVSAVKYSLNTFHFLHWKTAAVMDESAAAFRFSIQRRWPYNYFTKCKVRGEWEFTVVK